MEYFIFFFLFFFFLLFIFLYKYKYKYKYIICFVLFFKKKKEILFKHKQVLSKVKERK